MADAAVRFRHYATVVRAQTATRRYGLSVPAAALVAMLLVACAGADQGADRRAAEEPPRPGRANMAGMAIYPDFREDGGAVFIVSPPKSPQTVKGTVLVDASTEIVRRDVNGRWIRVGVRHLKHGQRVRIWATSESLSDPPDLWATTVAIVK